MPMRFSTEAANADVMGEDPQPAGVPEGKRRGRTRAPKATSDRSAGADPKPAPDEGDAKPGKDINAPGFVKDKDASKP